MERRISFRRTLAALLLLAAVAPGLWWRSEREPRIRTDQVSFEPLTIAAPRSGSEVALLGAWRLSSTDPRFGGYSALVIGEDDRLRAFSDSGLWLEFDPPGSGAVENVRFGSLRSLGGKLANDVEAAVYDRASDTTWLALEFSNSIRRIVGRDVVEAAPDAMSGFRDNGGAEAMTRLPDGRFIVLAESPDRLSPMRRTGLLFAADPVLDERAREFAFHPPPGYDPTDAAALPDGRVLILLRAISLKAYPPFASKLVVADPGQIEAGRPWPWREVAHIPDFAPRENYEGLAVAPGESGLVLWLISDANQSVLLQRTLLLKLLWKEALPGVRRPAPLS